MKFTPIQMKKIGFLIVLAFYCLPSNAQNLLTYESFIRKNFTEFVKHFPNLKFKNFITDEPEKIIFDEPLLTEHYNNKEWSKYVKTYKPFLQYNPSKTYFIDMLSTYTGIEYKNGKYYGVSDVDQAIKLGIVTQRKTSRLDIIGPTGGFSDAKWVNNSVVIIVGYFHNDDKEKNEALIQIFDIKNKTKTYYTNPKDVSSKPYIGKLFEKIIFE